MIKAHGEQLDLRLPRIGVIRKGGEMTRGATPDQNRPGKDLEYFRLDRAAPAVVTAWAEVMGKEPKSISGILPYSDPAECLSIWDELWQGKRLLWRGDGDRLHVQLQGDSYVRYAPGNGPAQPASAGEKVGKGKVTRLSRLRLLLPQMRIAGIFEVTSGSEIDADELWANLMWIRSTVATLQGAPVTVFRAPRQFNIPDNKKPGETMQVTKHMLHMMLDGRYLDALLPSPADGLLAPVQPPPALALTDGQAVEDDDAPEDGEYEDTPPAPAKPAAQPATATNGDGPLPDDEQAVFDASASEFVGMVAECLNTDGDNVKAWMKKMGHNKIPGIPEDRLAIYRKLRRIAERDAIDNIDDGNGNTGGGSGYPLYLELPAAEWQPATPAPLFTDDPDAAQAALATAQGQMD